MLIILILKSIDLLPNIFSFKSLSFHLGEGKWVVKTLSKACNIILSQPFSKQLSFVSLRRSCGWKFAWIWEKEKAAAAADSKGCNLTLNAKDNTEIVVTRLEYSVCCYIIHPTLDSSVGRAEDCRGIMQLSLGHWFDSGSRDNFWYN